MSKSSNSSLPILALLLSGCLSTRYGVDQKTWDRLTGAQKNATIASYNQRNMEDRGELLD